MNSPGDSAQTTDLRPSRQKNRTRRIWLKGAISCLLLTYLLSHTDISGIWDALKTANPLWVVIACLLHIIGVLLTALRWQMLLAVQGAYFSIWYLSRSILIGIFFNNFLPSTIGGDVYRAYDTAQQVGSATTSMTVVAFERLTGIFALGVFAFVAMLLGFSHFGQIPIIWLALGSVAGAFLLFFAAMQQTMAKIVNTIFEHPTIMKISAAQKVQAKLKQIYEALCLYKRNKRVMGITFSIALVLQLNVIIHYIFISEALELAVPGMYFLLIIPVVTIVLMLPIFINGIGGREAAFTFLFGMFNVTKVEAIAFTWIAFGLVLIYGIVGGCLYALRKD